MQKLRTRLFQTWFRLSRAMTLGVRGLVEDEGGRILLVRHTYISGLYFPGGGIERGEPAEVALGRELAEEAGVYMDEPAELVGFYSNHANFRNDHVLLYRVRAWHQGEATSRREISELVWVDPLAPPDDTTPGTKRRLAALFGEGDASHHW